MFYVFLLYDYMLKKMAAYFCHSTYSNNKNDKIKPKSIKKTPIEN